MAALACSRSPSKSLLLSRPRVRSSRLQSVRMAARATSTDSSSASSSAGKSSITSPTSSSSAEVRSAGSGETAGVSRAADENAEAAHGVEEYGEGRGVDGSRGDGMAWLGPAQAKATRCALDSRGVTVTAVDVDVALAAVEEAAAAELTGLFKRSPSRARDGARDGAKEGVSEGLAVSSAE
eukprot:2416160-Pleurochrysis_carterae.AAC.1